MARAGGYSRKQTEDEARLIKAKADIEEMKASEKAEKLVDAATIEKDFKALCLGFRNKMLAIPSSIAVELSENTNPNEVEEILKREISEALKALAISSEKENGNGI